MATPFIGELRIFSFSVIPKGWAQCNGQLLALNQNQALFSLLGTTYGGNGQTNFALPNLQGRAPAHVSSSLSQGEVVGQETHTLSTDELAVHYHPFVATNSAASTDDPTGATLAATTSPLYVPVTDPLVALASGMVSSVGGNQPHENRQPYLALNVCIALLGIFPSRS